MAAREAIRSWALSPRLAVALAVALVVAGLALALFTEHQSREQKIREVTVQAEILAGSVTAALAFDDPREAHEHVDALRINREVEAAGVYDLQGRLAAGFAREDERLPERNVVGPPRVEGAHLAVTAPVVQGGTTMGSVYLQTIVEPIGRRIARYGGIGFLLVMAALVVAVLGASNASLTRAHQSLQAEMAEREKVERALLQSQKMEAMGQLTGGVAHDFNNLLMVASSGLDLMDRTTDQKRIATLKQGIRQAIERGASLTQQLLAFSRRSPLAPEVVDLGERLRGMSALLDRSLREDITVHLRPAADLWPVEIDPAQLEVALLNIALNSRDAMPNGGVIVIDAENERDPAGLPAGEYVRLTVRDTGVGMPAELVSRAFEPFFTTKGVGKGTGMGLSQVYGFAKASGGDVSLESAEGVGTTLAIHIPRSMKPAPRSATAEADAAPLRADQARILLVEDDDTVAEMVGQMLDELGYDATRAPTARLALDVLGRDTAFDIVLSDMIMPGDMNGLELAHEIGRRHPDLPVLLTTGYSEAAAAAAGEGRRLLLKPYRIETLAAELAATRTNAPPARQVG
jgi:signal transduction histidine kinase/ActR/RegA family two-component response regulator